MKNFLKHILSVIIFIILIPSSTSCAISFENSNSQCETYPVSLPQLKAQLRLFKRVTDELGATSPLQVVKLWVKGDELRNGVYKYSVSCNELKNKLVKEWGSAEESYWIIGGSSPWLRKYEITKNKKIDNSTYEITIKYYWADSGGDSEPTFNKLTIIKNDKILLLPCQYRFLVSLPAKTN